MITRRSARRTLLVAAVAGVVLAATVAPDASARVEPIPPAGRILALPPWLGDVPGLGQTAPDAPPYGAFSLTGCTITNPLFDFTGGDAARAAALVPPRYTLGTNAYFGPTAVTVMATVLACNPVDTDTKASRALLSLVAIQIRSDAHHEDPAGSAWDLYNESTVNFLPSSSWYVVEAQTNDRAIASAFTAKGVPIDFLDSTQVSYRTDYLADTKSDTVSFPYDAGDYSVHTATKVADPFVHNHDWLFERELDDGTSAAFFLHLHGMADSSCGYHASPITQAAQPPCGATVDAPLDSRVCLLMGSTSRTTPYAFNHPTSSNSGYITFPTP